MRQIMIDFDEVFVDFITFDDTPSPTEILKRELESTLNLTTRCCTKYVLIATYDEEKVNLDRIKVVVSNCLDDRYEDEYDDIDQKYTLIEGYVTGDEKAKQQEQNKPEVLAGLEALFASQKMKNQERMDQAVANIEGTAISKEETDKTNKLIHKIESLVGATEFKSLAKELIGVADEIKRAKAFEIFAHKCYLFSIADGHGLSTYLKLMADIVWVKNLCPLTTRPVEETQLGAYKEDNESFLSARRAISGTKGKTQIVCIDISEWMNHTGSRYFKNFLRDIEEASGNNIYVFRVPFVDKDILAKIAYSISDVLSVRTVTFPPFTQEELKQCAQEQLKKYEFEMEEPAWIYFLERISQEKNDGKFYGIDTIVKVVKELVYHMHVVNSQRSNKSKLITAEDTKSLCGDVRDFNLTAEQMLDKLVGVDDIKKRVEEIVAQIQLSMRESGIERPCIHMRFVGNPGTGKTTVARIIGKMLKERGVLSIGSFFEHMGREFCGRYIGETSPKTAGFCRDAYGSVLFIDEAYSLFRGEDNTKDFGREAIDTLIAEMENHRNDLVIIMAGYTDDMNTLMKANSGLASRMPYTIEFPNFTRKQLADIFQSMVNKSFKADADLFDAVREFFDNLPDEVLNSKEFANARYVRNLFERTWAKASLRCQLEGSGDITITSADFKRASADKEFLLNASKKKRIGF